VTSLLIATNNPGKFREYEQLLGHLPLELYAPQDLELSIVVREDGGSYAQNAHIKAHRYAKASGLPTLADDSGLEVDAIAGEPGMFSARYGGEGATDAQRCQLLLETLRGVPWEERTARFRCVISLAAVASATHTAEGTCEGIIALTPQGSMGFGYDPIFYVPRYGQTIAQLPAEVKNRISHRGNAVRELLPVLTSVLVGPRGDGCGA
jgi:XTP/dITP diphosphohydrolase